MGIKQAIESVLGNTTESEEGSVKEQTEEAKPKAKRKSREDKYQDHLKICVEMLEEEREEMLEDVDGDLTRIGSERLAQYNEITSVLNRLRASLK